MYLHTYIVKSVINLDVYPPSVKLYGNLNLISTFSTSSGVGCTTEIEEVRAGYGRDTRNLMLVEWVVYSEVHPKTTSFQSERLLLRDGCKPTLDNFWLYSGINPTQDFFKTKRANQDFGYAGVLATTYDI